MSFYVVCLIEDILPGTTLHSVEHLSFMSVRLDASDVATRIESKVFPSFAEVCWLQCLQCKQKLVDMEDDRSSLSMQSWFRGGWSSWSPKFNDVIGKLNHFLQWTACLAGILIMAGQLTPRSGTPHEKWSLNKAFLREQLRLITPY